MKLDKEALTIGRKTLCEDAYRLLEAAYELKGKSKSIYLPRDIHSEIDTSSLNVVSLEGINCAGKTTQVEILSKLFESFSPFVPPRFYDGVPTRIIRNKTIGNFYQMYDPIVDSLLIASACLQKYDTLLKEDRRLILTDRNMDSLYVFQGRKLNEIGYPLDDSISWLMGLVEGIDRDKFRFFLDISLGEAENRSNTRNSNNGRKALTKEDLHELGRNIEAYRFLHQRFDRGYIKINAESTIEEVTQEILDNIELDHLRGRK